MLISVCGKSGSGKTSLSKELIERYGNAVRLDIDKVGHQVLGYKEVQEELIKAFGKEVVENNSVNRKKLGEKVFLSRKEMDKLTAITWKFMERDIDKFIEDNKDKIVILDWLLLPLTKFFDMCDFKILLDIDYKTRCSRAMKRDNITEEEFKMRDNASIDLSKYKFDYVLKTNSKKEIKRMVKKYEQSTLSG